MMKEKRIRNLISSPMVIFNDIKIATEVLKTCEPFRIVREKGITSKFYSWNHKIIRLDFSCRCSVLEKVILID